MNFQGKVNFLAQSQSGELFQQGRVQSDDMILDIEPQQGLAMLASGQSKLADDALKAVDILSDDMHTNLDTARQHDSPGRLDAAVSCMRESLQNINEYLAQLNRQPGDDDLSSAVSMLAIQLLPDRFCAACVGPYQCLVYQQDECKAVMTAESSAQSLGQVQALRVTPVVNPLAVGDMIVMTRKEDIEVLGFDFLRLTLSRFNDNPSMALRQINTRYSRQGQQHKPVMILVRIEQELLRKRSWLERLRNR